MNILLFLSFFLWIFLQYYAKTYKVFKKYSLFSKKWQKYRFGFTAYEVKKKMAETDNIDAKKELASTLTILRFSHLALLIFFILYFLVILKYI